MALLLLVNANLSIFYLQNFPSLVREIADFFENAKAQCHVTMNRGECESNDRFNAQYYVDTNNKVLKVSQYDRSINLIDRSIKIDHLTKYQPIDQSINQSI